MSLHPLPRIPSLLESTSMNWSESVFLVWNGYRTLLLNKGTGSLERCKSTQQIVRSNVAYLSTYRLLPKVLQDVGCRK